MILKVLELTWHTSASYIITCIKETDQQCKHLNKDLEEYMVMGLQSACVIMMMSIIICTHFAPL